MTIRSVYQSVSLHALPCPFVTSLLVILFRQFSYGVWIIYMPDYATPCLRFYTKLVNLPTHILLNLSVYIHLYDTIFLQDIWARVHEGS